MRLFTILVGCFVLLVSCPNTSRDNSDFNKELQDNKLVNQQLTNPQITNVKILLNTEQKLIEPQRIAKIKEQTNDELHTTEKQIENSQEKQNHSDNSSDQVKIEDYIQYDYKESELIENGGTAIYYLALGDSLTRGVGDETKKNGYTNRLADKIEQWTAISHVYLDNRGKRGRRSDQLLALIQKGHYDHEIENANLITITIGGNDMMKVVKENLFDLKKSTFDQELVGFEERYDQIIKEIRLRNVDVPIILIGFYSPFSLVADEVGEFEIIMEEWNNSMKELSNQQLNACFVDVVDLFEDNAQLVYHTDFFHPNGYGYTMITERITQSCNIQEISGGLILFGQEHAFSE